MAAAEEFRVIPQRLRLDARVNAANQGVQIDTAGHPGQGYHSGDSRVMIERGQVGVLFTGQDSRVVRNVANETEFWALHDEITTMQKEIDNRNNSR